MAKPYHTDRSSFNWQSNLSDKRKDEIIKWEASLTTNQVKMLDQIVTDIEADTYDSSDTDL